MTERRPLLLMAAGGTGGHMFPAQSLAETMLARGWRVKLSTDERGARYTQGFPEAVEIEQIASATFSRGGILAKLAVPFRILKGIISATRAARRDRPDVVIGFGGYPTIPALTAARLLKLPRMIHEQNGVLGRVNGRFAKHVHVVACGIWPTQGLAGVEAVHVGNPVRAAVAARAGANYIPPGEYPMLILVIGGSQGARVLSKVVPEAISMLPASMLHYVRVHHQARPEDREAVEHFYYQNGIDADVQPFFDDLPDRLAEAQLVISRAGASSVADISVIGRPSILIPLPIATNDHQSANARGLVDAGASVLMPESLLDASSLCEQIRLVLTQSKGAGLMAQAALGVSVPDATDRLAELVEDLAEGNSAA